MLYCFPGQNILPPEFTKNITSLQIIAFQGLQYTAVLKKTPQKTQHKPPKTKPTPPHPTPPRHTKNPSHKTNNPKNKTLKKELDEVGDPASLSWDTLKFGSLGVLGFCS